jgi:3-hydroxyisobutyrate dehydrogenase-like beta-hydroxyacid dehydrogenase
MRIGFIGLGKMGSAMARNLLRGGSLPNTPSAGRDT